MGFERRNARSRIADLGGLAVHPDFRGRRIADEAARQLSSATSSRSSASTGSSSRSTASTSVRSSTRSASASSREGVKRKAYLRHGEWVDGVLFGLVREDLEA